MLTTRMLLSTPVVVGGVRVGTARDLLETSPKRRAVERLVAKANQRALREAKKKGPKAWETMRARIARTYRGKRLPAWLKPKPTAARKRAK